MDVFPGKDALSGPEALLEDGGINAPLATPLRYLVPTRILGDVGGGHAAIEDCTAVAPTVVDTIQADGGTMQVRANGAGHFGKLGKASHNSGDSLQLPGTRTNGAMTLQWRSQKGTTLSPLRCCGRYNRGCRCLSLQPSLCRRRERLSYQAGCQHESCALSRKRWHRCGHRPASDETIDRCACS
jgi:hypothetical protein